MLTDLRMKHAVDMTTIDSEKHAINCKHQKVGG